MTTKVILLSLALTLAVALPGAFAQCPINNPSFESGTIYPDNWTTYSYTVLGDDAGLPEIGCVGSSPCVFTVLPPSNIPDGSKVCGLQSNASYIEPYEYGKNGGIYQTFTWNGGSADITIKARAYSENLQLDEQYNWQWTPYDNGCRVRAGIVNGTSDLRTEVTNWVACNWGSIWNDINFHLSNGGTYTLFIESYHPNANAAMSTLWDNITWKSYIVITQTPTAQIGPDPNNPDTTALITWTTDTPSTSRVDYGTTTSYGQYVYDSSLVKQHSVLLQNLSHSTQYHYKVTCTAPLATDVSSGDYSFELPINISDVSATTEGFDVVVRWTTDVATTSQVEYGKTIAYGSTSTLDTNLTTSHEVILSGLDEDEDYHFRVLSTRTNYNSVASDDNVYHTLPYAKTSLQNASFEDGVFPWVQYTASTSGNQPIDGRIGPYPASGGSSWSSAAIKAYDGSYFIGADASEVVKNGGMLQRLYWPAGTLCSFTARFATNSVGGGYYDTRARLGIDPNGGLDPTASGIVWWKGFSPTNDNVWYPGGVMATAGSGGIVTVFLDIYQQYPIISQTVAIDDATFGSPVPMTIGAIKQEKRCPGVEIQNAVVTLIASSVTYEGYAYTRAYVQPDNSPSGIAVLFKQGSGTPPSLKDKVTVKGTLANINKEASVIAYDWSTTTGPFDLPSPYAMAGKSIGGKAYNQPALYASQSICNLGTRMRIWGRVTLAISDWGSNTTTCLINDGSNIVEDPTDPLYGIRVILAGVEPEVYEGDYITVTGVLTMQHVDPDYTPGSGDEYELYELINNSTDEWTCIPAE